MTLPVLKIKKNWFTGTTVIEGDWDNIINPLLNWASKINLAFNQVSVDAFGSTYNINNSGTPELPVSLQDQINAIVSGGAAIIGTANPTWTIHFGFADRAILDTTGLTGARTFTFPDSTDVIAGITAVQNISGKTFTDNLQWLSGTAFLAILDHANTAPRTYTFPNDSGTVVLQNTTNTGPLPPIGTIHAFYDFGTVGNPPPGLVTFDTNYYRYCDGTVLVYPASPLNGQTLPDMSGRYLVGFGTDGGGDIDTAVFAIVPIGNANHQINIQHAHTVNAHTHTMGNHTHNVVGHYHSLGDIHINSGGSHHHTFVSTNNPGAAGIPNINPDPQGDVATDSFFNGTLDAAHAHPTVDFLGNVGNIGSGIDGDNPFASAGPSTNTTSSTSPGTDNQLSTTQSIQPRSIRVRYIMRVL